MKEELTEYQEKNITPLNQQIGEYQREEGGNTYDGEGGNTYDGEGASTSTPSKEYYADENGNYYEDDGRRHKHPHNDKDKANTKDDIDTYTAYANYIEKNILVNKFEAKVDWNLISVSSIWIFLTLTFFGIFF